MLELTNSGTEGLVVGETVTRPILMHHASIKVVHEHGKPAIGDRSTNHKEDTLHLEGVVVLLVEFVAILQTTCVLISETGLRIAVNLYALCQVNRPVRNLFPLGRLGIHAADAHKAQQHSKNRCKSESHNL